MAPSRRRGSHGKTSAPTARSAAIQAAEKRRREEQEYHTSCGSNNSKSISSNGDDKGNGTSISVYDDAGKKRKNVFLSQPVAADATTTSTASSSTSVAQEFVMNAKQAHPTQPYCKVVPSDKSNKNTCSQRSRYGRMTSKRKQDFDHSEGGVDADDDNEDEGCLHCHEKVKYRPRVEVIDDECDNNSDEGYCRESNIQVQCDDCRGYVCNGCHWCHEFQANHEIRVCDRCDAFYCRGCDEMDQCDDCGEVVCGSCSTLLSCKFCGGGLCEECATACGRCGIVLCSRDAKFAVDCDTCRLSYCLVCLASGSKEPCVRCGHRPSKRMEQLVHLRLKSIYKAFKSSSSNNSNVGPSRGESYSNNKNTGKGNSRINDKHDEYGGGSRRNKPTTLQDMVGDHDDKDAGGIDPAMSMMMMETAEALPHKFCHDLEQNYLAEQKKADAAAEALLAEIEEEESAIAQKKSKKKKKKERKNASKESQRATKSNTGSDKSEKKGNNAEENYKMQQNVTAGSESREVEVNDDSLSDSDSIDQIAKSNYGTDKLHEDSKMDPIEKELVECVNNHDIEGIENVLLRLKGVPGRAVLRKNAKKALKRLKLEMNPIQSIPLENKPEVVTKPEKKPTVVTNRLIATSVDSRISPKKASTKSTTNPEKSGYNRSTHQKSSPHKNTGSDRCEATVEIVSRLVGWMIGKNGQRIRDLMEESGAKIWIDQEKFKGQETRNVHMSGDRKSVDKAVLLVNDVVTNAPPPQGTKNPVLDATASIAKMTISQNSTENTKKTTGLTPLGNSASAQTNIPGSLEVKSAWNKASESSRRAEKLVPGMIPKPPALISSPIQVPTERGNKDPNGKPVQYTESPGMLTNLRKSSAETPAGKISTTSNVRNNSAKITTEIVTCDLRFVPLLIGKRGWTIKNIQDDSGARVDIDQTVTPRQVRISGSEPNVKKAVTMVQDVLSYPQAQLQSSSEDDENAAFPELETDIKFPTTSMAVSTPTKQKLLAASAALERDRVHSPPPLVGDAKSAISASSSLSSTPEPSMASSSKGFIASHLQNGPLLPPPAGHYTMGNAPSQSVQRQVLQSDGGVINGLDAGGIWTSAAIAPRPPFNDSSVPIDFQSGGPIPLSHGAHAHPQMHLLQRQGQQIQMNNALINEHHYSQGNPELNHRAPESFVSTERISHSNPLGTNLSDNLINSSQFNNQNTGNNQHNNGMHASLGRGPPYIPYSNEGIPTAQAIPTTAPQSLMHHGPGLSSPTRGTEFIDGSCRLWNSGNPTYSSPELPLHAPALQPQSSSGFAATASSLGISSGFHQVIPSHQTLPNQNSLSVTANSTNFSQSVPPGLGNDDSRMIDSLFGGIGHTESSKDATTHSVLPGLDRLSLPNKNNEANPSMLWGPSDLTEAWSNKKDNQMNPDVTEAANLSSMKNIFSNEIPTSSHERPQESRFNWD